MPTSSSVAIQVIDANVLLWTLLPELAKVDTGALLGRWSRERQILTAPSLLRAECVSSIRFALYKRYIPPSRAEQALVRLLKTQLQLEPLDDDLCRAALHWAEQLNQARAYDGFYLALAERLGAQFWTADERLVNRARQVGAQWVHWVGEAEE